MRPRITGFGLGNAIVQGSVQWDYVQSNKDLARRLVVFLQNRHVLTEANTTREDPEECWESVQDIRNWLVLEMMNVKGGGELEKAIEEMRKASAAFVRAAGKKGASFNDLGYFNSCLDAYRQVVLQELRWLVDDYELRPNAELQAVLPPYN